MSAPLFYNVGGTALEERAVFSAINNVIGFSGVVAGSARYDSDGGRVAGPDAIDAYASHIERVVGQIRANTMGWRPSRATIDLAIAAGVRTDAKGVRLDSIGAGLPSFLNDYTFRRVTPFEEPRRPRSMQGLLPVDRSVPLGARSHTAWRLLGSGEAHLVEKGSSIPVVSSAKVEETFKVAHVAAGVSRNWFDMLTSDWADQRRFDQDMRLAINAVEEKINRLLVTGDVNAGLYGLLNYPHAPKMVVDTPITDASTGAAICNALNDVINTARLLSGGVYSYDTVAMSPEVEAYLSSREHSAAGTRSILEKLKLDQAGKISRWVIVPELSEAGPAGEDVFLPFNSSVTSISQVEIQAPTLLPMYQSGQFDYEHTVIATTGGVVAADAAEILIAYVTR